MVAKAVGAPPPHVESTTPSRRHHDPAPMFSTASLITAVAGALMGAASVAAAPMNKCVVDGTVTYQQARCAADRAAKRPSLDELNAQTRAKRAAAAASASASPSPSPSAPRERIPTPFPAKPSAFQCDGRQYCSQMSSCEEAKYFLARCPGTKMDGDHDGVPCEDQWCSR